MNREFRENVLSKIKVGETVIHKCDSKDVKSISKCVYTYGIIHKKRLSVRKTGDGVSIHRFSYISPFRFNS